MSSANSANRWETDSDTTTTTESTNTTNTTNTNTSTGSDKYRSKSPIDIDSDLQGRTPLKSDAEHESETESETTDSDYNSNSNSARSYRSNMSHKSIAHSPTQSIHSNRQSDNSPNLPGLAYESDATSLSRRSNPYIMQAPNSPRVQPTDQGKNLHKQSALRKFLQKRSHQVLFATVIITLFALGMFLAKMYRDKKTLEWQAIQNSGGQLNKIQTFLLTKNVDKIAYAASVLAATGFVIALGLSRQEKQVWPFNK